MVIEYSADDEEAVLETLQKHGVGRCCQVIGCTSGDKHIKLRHMDQLILSEDMQVLRGVWSETSFELEKLQTAPECAKAESEGQMIAPVSDSISRSRQTGRRGGTLKYSESRSSYSKRGGYQRR